MSTPTKPAQADIAISVRDGVQTIRLTRVDKKNAMTGAMYDAAREALVAAEANEDIAVHVFMGSGGVFCAGNDMNDFMRRASGPAAPSGSAGAMVRAPSSEFIRCLPTITKPMLAAVDGLAVGIGVTLLLHCDLVLAAPSASLRAPFVNLGIIQEAGSSHIGPHRLGYNNAFELLILGHPWSAERAKEAGLVNCIVPAAELEDRALALARDLAEKPRAALMAARRMLRGDHAVIVETIDKEVATYSALIASPEAKEAFSAFLEKRKPDFARARAAGKRG